MKRRTGIVVSACVALVVAALAYFYADIFPAPQPPAPQPPAALPKPVIPPPRPGEPIDEATVEAWTRAGFEPTYRTMRMDEKLPELRPDRDGVGDAELATVPVVRVPFTLYLGRRTFTDAGLPHLARHPYLTGLDLSFSGVTDAGLPHLAAIKTLRMLDLRRTAVTTAGLRKHLPQFAHLTTLKVDAKHLTDETLAAFVEHGLLRLLVRRYQYRPPGAEADEVVVSLDLSGAPVTDDGLKHVATVTDLRSLVLVGTKVTGPGLRHLSGLASLHTINLDTLTDELLRGLAEARLLHALLSQTGKRAKREEDVEYVYLGGTQITDAGLEHLAGLTGLQNIDLMSTRVTGEGFRHLAKLDKLRTASLERCRLTAEGLKQIATVKNLSTIYMSGSLLPPEAVRHLAGLKNLRRLCVSSGAVTDETLQALVETGLIRVLTGPDQDNVYHWGVQSYMRGEEAFPTDAEGITSLNLMGSNVTDEGLKHLAGLKNLEALYLGSALRGGRDTVSTISGEGLKHLAGLEKLRHLTLSGEQLTDASLGHVTVLKNLTSLRVRKYSFAKVTADGLNQLAALKKLTHLDLSTYPGEFRAEHVAELQKALPKCKIER